MHSFRTSRTNWYNFIILGNVIMFNLSESVKYKRLIYLSTILYKIEGVYNFDTGKTAPTYLRKNPEI